MTTIILQVILTALAAQQVAETVTTGEIFAPFRAKLEAKAEVAGGLWRWIAKLLTCPYCLIHHLAFWLLLSWWLLDRLLPSTGAGAVSAQMTVGVFVPQVFATVRLATILQTYVDRFNDAQ